jgi:hypothetical protein
MEPMMAYSGNNLLTMVVHRVYATQRNSFKGSGTSSGFAYSFDVTEAPGAALIPNSAARNVELALSKVMITVTGGGLNFNANVPMLATATLAVSQGIISLTNLKVTTTSANPIDRAIVAIINTQIIPQISAVLAGIPVPQLTNLFGSGLSASLRTARVIAGPALELGAGITGRSGIGAADAPAAATLASLNNGSATNALAAALVSSGAVNVLIKALIPPLSESFDNRGSKAGFGAGIKGTIKATTPVLAISGGSGEATTTISFSGLKGGIRIPVKGWTWVSLPSPSPKVVVTNTLSVSGRSGILTLTGVSSITVSLNWPSVLKPVGDVLKTLLNGILSLFRGKISNAVKGKKFTLFTLPTTIPGTNLAASLSFAQGGLGYMKGSVQALVRMTTS